MKKIGITLLILAIYSTSAWSQMRGGMIIVTEAARHMGGG